MLLVVCLMAYQNAKAFDIESDGIYYNVISATDLTAEVTAGSVPYSGSIEIPSTVEFRCKQLSVIKIGQQAFKGCTGLTNISFSEGLTSIAYEAFNGCSNIEILNFPSSLKRIEDYYTFAYCSKLTAIHF